MHSTSWQKDKGGGGGGQQQANELSSTALRMMDDAALLLLMFDAIRASDIPSLKKILAVNEKFVTAPMFGFEGSDVHGIIKVAKGATSTGRCYTYTGKQKDGYFYPLHVAAEAGHKKLCLMLVGAGAEVLEEDYRGETAEQKANGEAVHAFYELRGLHFEETQRYIGSTDRTGKPSGQGSMFVKQQGYDAREMLLFRGGFKNGKYQGHGTLYWPGSDKLRYVGRFKNNQKHGRGVEFDEAGNKVYNGTFREDKRDGRGEEFSASIGDVLPNSSGGGGSSGSASTSNKGSGSGGGSGGGVVRIYKGEFQDNARHGFGIAFYAEGHRFVGRFENNVKAGVGIYCYPNGDRFEGMFYEDKPDGPGSYYSRDKDTGAFQASHYIWEKNRRVKETGIPFMPQKLDMPDDQSIVLDMKETRRSLLSVSGGDLGEGDDDNDNVSVFSISSLASSSSLAHAGAGQSGRSKSRSFLRTMPLPGDECSKDWKLLLGKYVKVPLKDAKIMGLVPPSSGGNKHSSNSNSSGFEDDDEEEDGEEEKEEPEEEEEEEDEEEGLGGRFVDFPALLVAYVYVCSAAKVFEGRVASETDMATAAPDFEAVYHLVIDAVESYNESWEKAFRAQQAEALEAANAKAAVAAEGEKSGWGGRARAISQPEQGTVIAKRQAFMTPAQKRAELARKQRLELAAKNRASELSPEIEREIGEATLAALEQELAKLLADELEETASIVASASATGRIKWSERKVDEQQQQQQRGNGSPRAVGAGASSASSSSLDGSSSPSHRHEEVDDDEEHHVTTNEFAAELLYIMRSARDLLETKHKSSGGSAGSGGEVAKLA